jgi:hypothetical protein
MPKRLAVILLTVLLTADHMPAFGQSRLTSASNVRLRAAPSADAPVISTLSLGTELQDAGRPREDEWVAVRTEDGLEGWVAESLTRSISEATYNTVIEDVVLDRLSRRGDGFEAHSQLVSFIERSLLRDRALDARARLDLNRLQAIGTSLQHIPFTRSRWSDAIRSWVTARAAEITYDEPGGRWILRRDVILEVHDRHRSTPSADDIAWLAVSNGLDGECEGVVLCYLRIQDMLAGEYLRRHPAGKHADEAVRSISTTVSYADPSDDDMDFDPGRECRDLEPIVHALHAAVVNSNAREKDDAGAALLNVLSLCPAALPPGLR